MSGLDLIKELRRVQPTLPTLVLSMHPAVAVRAARAERGRDRLPHEGQQARGVRHRHRGARGAAGATSAATRPSLLLRQGARWESPPHDSLSDREYQVLRTARIRPDDLGHRTGSGAERQDRQHLSRAGPREARHAHQRRVDALRDREQPARIRDCGPTRFAARTRHRPPQDAPQQRPSPRAHRAPACTPK